MQRATGALSSGAGSCPQLNSTLNAESCERKAEMQSVRWKISVGHTRLERRATPGVVLTGSKGGKTHSEAMKRDCMMLFM